jgi:dienelactone hydrolase
VGQFQTAVRGGWHFRPGHRVIGPLDLVTQVPVTVGDRPVHLHMVFSDDGVYVPAVVMQPEGSGPWPAIICLHGGSGGLGASWLIDFAVNRGHVFERLCAEGYVVVWTEGRKEIEYAYGTDIPAVLDHDDVVNTFRYVQDLSFVDPERVGFFGVSHGGELQMKVISELGHGPAALVPSEPAVVEFLELRIEGPRTEANLQFNDELTDDQIDLAVATKRIEPIDPDLPILVLGRDDDHLQGVFKKLHELLERAGKNVEWESFDHPEHAYHWGPVRTQKVVGYEGSVADVEATYDIDPVMVATLTRVVTFLNRYVRDRHSSS